MQTFFKMQRNSIIKKNISLLAGFLCFGIYIFLTDLFVILPPMVGLLFLCFAYFLKNSDFQKLLLTLPCLFFIELDKNITFGSLFVCFLLLYLTAYNPLFYLFKNAFYFRITHLILIYMIFGFLVFALFDHSLDRFIDIFKLILGYIFIEGLVLLAYEYKS